VTDDPPPNDVSTLVPVQVGMTLVEAQNLLIKATLQRTEGNIKRAAAVLGIDRSTLYAKIKRYGL
jgi:transcriptional regulator of acetoin/glycerol metabolism